MPVMFFRKKSFVPEYLLMQGFFFPYYSREQPGIAFRIR